MVIKNSNRIFDHQIKLFKRTLHFEITNLCSWSQKLCRHLQLGCQHRPKKDYRATLGLPVISEYSAKAPHAHAPWRITPQANCKFAGMLFTGSTPHQKQLINNVTIAKAVNVAKKVITFIKYVLDEMNLFVLIL